MFWGGEWGLESLRCGVGGGVWGRPLSIQVLFSCASFGLDMHACDICVIPIM